MGYTVMVRFFLQVRGEDIWCFKMDKFSDRIILEWNIEFPRVEADFERYLLGNHVSQIRRYFSLEKYTYENNPQLIP